MRMQAGRQHECTPAHTYRDADLLPLLRAPAQHADADLGPAGSHACTHTVMLSTMGNTWIPVRRHATRVLHALLLIAARCPAQGCSSRQRCTRALQWHMARPAPCASPQRGRLVREQPQLVARRVEQEHKRRLRAQQAALQRGCRQAQHGRQVTLEWRAEGMPGTQTYSQSGGMQALYCHMPRSRGVTGKVSLLLGPRMGQRAVGAMNG